MERLISNIDFIFGRYAVIVRYLFSGGTAFGVNIVLLYILKEYLRLHYLTAAVIAFIVAFLVSFSMMKHVTFRDGRSEGVDKQMTGYFAVAIFNLMLNSVLIYLFVDKMNVWYILAQALSSIIIAVWSFFIYKYVIFVKIPEVI